MAARPAARAATAARAEESRAAYCYEEAWRHEYLVEVYECHARGEGALFRELNKERGKAGANVYREVIEEDVRDRRVCEKTNCQNCVVM